MNALQTMLCCALGAIACENREAFRRPEPGLERMLSQPRAGAYRESRAFSDERAMRAPVSGTVPREHPHPGELLFTRGRDRTGYARAIPLPVTRELLQRGRATFNTVCATCHGVLGDGHSFVAEKMELRKPPSFFEPRLEQLAPGRIFEAISQGYGLMPSFAGLLSVDDRWAAIAYIDALRLSREARVTELPVAWQSELAKEAP